MKIKTIIWIFNVVILISFAFVGLMPVFVLGWEYAGTFWAANWYLILIFLAALAVLNGYFIVNRNLFSALEREDWESVTKILEHRIYVQHRIAVSNIRTLVNSYVVLSRSSEISRLEKELEKRAPAKLNKTCLLFGISHILTSKGEEIERYYGAFRERTTGSVHDWVEWHYAFGLLLQERFDEGRTVLTGLSSRRTSDILKGCTLYLLDSFVGEQNTEVDSLREKYTPQTWRSMVERKGNELHILVLTRLLRDVESWLFPQED